MNCWSPTRLAEASAIHGGAHPDRLIETVPDQAMLVRALLVDDGAKVHLTLRSEMQHPYDGDEVVLAAGLDHPLDKSGSGEAHGVIVRGVPTETPTLDTLSRQGIFALRRSGSLA